MSGYKVIGYYLCEVVDTPEYLRKIEPDVGPELLSVSGCLGEIHPKWECVLGGWMKGEEQAYRQKLRLTDDRYLELVEASNALFDKGRLDVDGRFLYLEDARQFWTQFFSEVRCQLVSVSTSEVHLDILKEELRGSQSHGAVSGDYDRFSLVGYDILGWDMAGFHSFLCNSLHRGLPADAFNEMGLLQQTFCFEEIAAFAQNMKGRGEPVEWIPCRIGRPAAGADGGIFGEIEK